MSYPELLPEHREALEAFAAAHPTVKRGPNKGWTWRDELGQVYWYNARIWEGGPPNAGSTLQYIRNHFGPTWLIDEFKLESEIDFEVITVAPGHRLSRHPYVEWAVRDLKHADRPDRFFDSEAKAVAAASNGAKAYVMGQVR